MLNDLREGMFVITGCVIWYVKSILYPNWMFANRVCVMWYFKSISKLYVFHYRMCDVICRKPPSAANLQQLTSSLYIQPVAEPISSRQRLMLPSSCNSRPFPLTTSNYHNQSPEEALSPGYNLQDSDYEYRLDSSLGHTYNICENRKYVFSSLVWDLIFNYQLISKCIMCKPSSPFFISN